MPQECSNRDVLRKCNELINNLRREFEEFKLKKIETLKSQIERLEKAEFSLPEEGE